MKLLAIVLLCSTCNVLANSSEIPTKNKKNEHTLQTNKVASLKNILLKSAGAQITWISVSDTSKNETKKIPNAVFLKIKDILLNNAVYVVPIDADIDYTPDSFLPSLRFFDENGTTVGHLLLTSVSPESEVKKGRNANSSIMIPDKTYKELMKLIHSLN